MGIAARLWQHAGLAAAASSGLAKLRAAGVEVDPQATLGVEPVVTVDPAVRPADRRGPGAPGGHLRLPGARGRRPRPPAICEPWGVVCWRGRWYVVGHDRDRARDPLLPALPDRRHGPASAGSGRRSPRRRSVDLISHVARWSGPVERTGRATVLVRPGRAAGLRRWAVESVPGPDGDRADPAVRRRRSGWPPTLVGYGADVRVLDPPEVRDAVIQQLKEIVARHDELAVGRWMAPMTRPRRGRGGPAHLGRPARPGCSTWCPTCWPGPGIAVAEAAADLGVTERQLREDLELLWVCGLPGYGPGDLIDMAFDGDRVTITYDAGIDRPLRLTPDEALALVVALRMLAETPGIGEPGRHRTGPGQDRERGRRAGRRAGGGAAARQRPNGSTPLRAAVERRPRPAPHVLHAGPRRDHRARRRPDAGADGRRAGLPRGVVPARRGDPAVPGRPDRRVHRAGRAVRAAGRRPCRTTSARASSGPAPDLPLVTLRVGRGGRWITEYYPCEEVHRAHGDEWVVTMRVTDLGWAQRFLLGLGPDVTVVGPAGAGRADPRAGHHRARGVRRAAGGPGRGPLGWPPW